MRQPDCRSLGLIQAIRVIAVPRFSEAEAGTRTTSSAPANRMPAPKRPELVQVAPRMLPAFPLPEASVAIRPRPASNGYAATRWLGSGPAPRLSGAAMAASTSDRESARS